MRMRAEEFHAWSQRLQFTSETEALIAAIRSSPPVRSCNFRHLIALIAVMFCTGFCMEHRRVSTRSLTFTLPAAPQWQCAVERPRAGALAERTP